MDQQLMISSWTDILSIQSTLYSVQLRFNQLGLSKLDMVPKIEDEIPGGTPPMEIIRVHQWLVNYFNGEFLAVDFLIDWSQFTPFQRCVLEAVSVIPAGEVSTYKDVAARINQPKAIRAAAHAISTNPLPIVIPCHRVIGSDGRLHGYSGPGGLAFKEYLLRMEGLSIEHKRVV
jgi:methylated-DNA-[protein]-cysteine S-methyltransferase